MKKLIYFLLMAFMITITSCLDTMHVPVINSISISSRSPNDTLFQFLQLSAQAKDSHGNVISTPISWSSSDTNLAIIDSTGLMYATIDSASRKTIIEGGLTEIPVTIFAAAKGKGIGSSIVITIKIPMPGKVGDLKADSIPN